MGRSYQRHQKQQGEIHAGLTRQIRPKNDRGHVTYEVPQKPSKTFGIKQSDIQTRHLAIEPITDLTTPGALSHWMPPAIYSTATSFSPVTAPTSR